MLLPKNNFLNKNTKNSLAKNSKRLYNNTMINLKHISFHQPEYCSISTPNCGDASWPTGFCVDEGWDE